MTKSNNEENLFNNKFKLDKFTKYKLDYIKKKGFDNFVNHFITDETMTRFITDNIEYVKNHGNIEYVKQPIILSDVDDTLFTSSNDIGGIDRSLPAHTLYPGVKSFHDCIQSELPLIILTARPEFLKSPTYETFNNKYPEKKVIIIFGDIKNIPNVFLCAYLHIKCDDRNEGLGNTKINSALTFQLMFPELDIIYIGDNGQGDMITAHELSKYKIHSFIHIVKEIDNKYVNKYTHYFNTYIGAAIWAKYINLIDDKCLDKIIKQFKNDLEDIGIVKDKDKYNYKKLIFEDLKNNKNVYDTYNKDFVVYPTLIEGFRPQNSRSNESRNDDNDQDMEKKDSRPNTSRTTHFERMQRLRDKLK